MLITSRDLYELEEVAREFGIPTIDFYTADSHGASYPEAVVVTDEQMNLWTSDQGKNEEWKTIEWKGRQLVVLFDYPPEKIAAAPIECIDLNA